MRNPEWQNRRPCRFFEYLLVRHRHDVAGALDILWGTRCRRVTDGVVGGNGIVRFDQSRQSETPRRLPSSSNGHRERARAARGRPDGAARGCWQHRVAVARRQGDLAPHTSGRASCEGRLLLALTYSPTLPPHGPRTREWSDPIRRARCSFCPAQVRSSRLRHRKCLQVPWPARRLRRRRPFAVRRRPGKHDERSTRARCEEEAANQDTHRRTTVLTAPVCRRR